MDPIVIIVGIVLVLTIVIILFALSRSKGGATPKWKQEIISAISKLEIANEKGNTLVLKNSLIEADKILDHTMRHRGLQGQTMGERLKNANRYFDRDTYNKIWEAHKLRNNLVHEMNYPMSETELKRQFKVLASAIRTLSK